MHDCNNSVFFFSLLFMRMFMHWETMFDPYYCIKTENICYISRYFLHFFAQCPFCFAFSPVSGERVTSCSVELNMQKSFITSGSEQTVKTAQTSHNAESEICGAY